MNRIYQGRVSKVEIPSFLSALIAFLQTAPLCNRTASGWTSKNQNGENRNLSIFGFPSCLSNGGEKVIFGRSQVFFIRVWRRLASGICFACNRRLKTTCIRPAVLSKYASSEGWRRQAGGSHTTSRSWDAALLRQTSALQATVINNHSPLSR